MPIRMTDDPRSGGSGSRPPRRPGGGGGGGGGNPLIYFLPNLIGFLFRRPKLAIVLIVICVVGYLIFGKGCNLGSLASGGMNSLGTGCDLNEKAYDSVLVYEPLAETGNGRMAESVSLLKYAPSRLSQGSQGSCVGWASSYGARTILYARQSGKDPNSVAFSPSFLYNQIALSGCDGTYLKRAMEVLQEKGDVFLSKFPYDENSCSSRPPGSLMSEAAAFRIEGYTRLSEDAEDYAVHSDAIRENLAQGGPVVIGMRVGGSFMDDMEGKDVWFPTEDDYNDVERFGGHAMCVIGYNDAKEGGAFQIMNSWGNDWGVQGVAWVKYEDFEYFVHEAYGLYPMGEAAKATSQVIHFGLTEYAMKGGDFTAKGRIAVKQVSKGVYQTTQAIRKGTRFKVEFSNSIPCYTYIFGQETDGSSYVLFPYTEKHSPYCGTTGTRIFPRDQSLTADDIGTRDYIAVVISYEPLDFNNINDRISKASGRDYAEKLRKGLGTMLSTSGSYGGDGALIELKPTDKDLKKVHALVIGFDKR